MRGSTALKYWAKRRTMPRRLAHCDGWQSAGWVAHRSASWVVITEVLCGDFGDHGFHGRPCRFDEVGSHLLEQISTFLTRKCHHQMLLSSGQDAFEPHDHQVIDQVRANVLGTSAHVFLFEAAHAVRNGTFYFALRLHSAYNVPQIGLLWASASSASRREPPQSRV